MGLFLRELMLFAEVLLIVAPVIVVVGLLRRTAAARRHALEVERLAAMRAAIDKGVLQEADRAALLAAMAGNRSAPTAAQSWPVAVGWVAGFVGIGLLLIGDQELRATGIVVALLGLGLVTLPLAQRELARRDRRPA